MVWHHNDYSEEALAEMQREAEERVREMQSRARLLAAGGPQPQIRGQSRPPENPQRQNPDRRQNPASQGAQPQNFQSQDSPRRGPRQQEDSPSNFFPQNPPQQGPPPGAQFSPAPQPNFQSGNPFGEISKFIGNVGEDRLIVLAILWLLWNEHADGKLLLALLYILM